jgi:hypothetical protein
MRPVHFRMLSIVIVSGLAAVLISCAKSEAPQPLANKQPAPTQQVNTAAPSVTTQPSPQQATTASADSGKEKVDACTLLTSKEIQSVQGEALKEAKSSERSEGGFSTSQCFFTLPTFTNSISLTVTRRGDGPGARDPKQFWKETFHRETESEQARDRDRNKGRERNEGREEEEEQGAPPQKITGVGDEAFWAGSRFGGALYVLKGNAFIRVSVGGTGDQQTKIKKSKALAQMVLKHQ